jgi:3-oxoadipate enol-lactonase
MPVANVNDCEIYYEVRGSGPALVFVHGESHGIEMFDRQVLHFRKEHSCLTYYRRGHGKSQLAPYGYSMWNQSLDLAKLLDHLHIGPAVIVAVAMSTSIAVTYAVNHPESVRGLVLTSWYELEGYPLLEGRRRRHGVSFGNLQLKMEDFLHNGGPEGLKRFMAEEADTYFPIFPEDPHIRAEVIRMFASHPPGHYIKSAEFYTSMPNLLVEVERIACPILGICGDEDPSPDKPDLLAHVPNFRQEWIRGSRRFPMLEQPAKFNEVLSRFIHDVRS